MNFHRNFQNWLTRQFVSLSTKPRRRRRPRTMTTRLETLESRELLTTMLYLNCGAEMAQVGTAFHATVDEVKTVDGAGLNQLGTGPDMTTEVGLPGNTLLKFRNLDYDWNANGTPGEEDDMNGMCTAVLELVNRSLDAYDIVAVEAKSSGLNAVVNTLDVNNGHVNGEHDAYVYVGEVYYKQEVTGVKDPIHGKLPPPWVSVGLTHSTSGMAGRDDFVAAGNVSQFDPHKNLQDEMAITFADQVLAETPNMSNVPEGERFLNRRLAFHLADSVLRNAMETFGIQETGHATNADEQRLTLGESVRHLSQNLVQPSDDAGTHNITTNFDLVRWDTPAGEFYNPYVALTTDSDIGRRDIDSNTIPDVAYITGSGADDVIEVVPNAAGTGFDVTVSAYTGPNMTSGTVIRKMQYTIVLGQDTEGPILIDAGMGDDLVTVMALDPTNVFTIRGGAGNDVIVAGNARNVIYGDTGDDSIQGGFFTDRIYAGYGVDTVNAQRGNDRIFGEHGTLYVGGGEPDVLFGANGSDMIRGDGGNDTIFGGEGNDSMFGGVGRDWMVGGKGDDIMFGGVGRDWMFAGQGDDLMVGGKGDDIMVGGIGDDIMVGGMGNDLMLGQIGNDKMFGADGNDRMYGGTGHDFMAGGLGADAMYGGADDDVMYASDAANVDDGKQDTLHGNAGNDSCLIHTNPVDIWIS